jgi:hypothetical protein
VCGSASSLGSAPVVSRSCSLRSRAAPARRLPLLLAALTGRSGPGLFSGFRTGPIPPKHAGSGGFTQDYEHVRLYTFVILSYGAHPMRAHHRTRGIEPMINRHSMQPGPSDQPTVNERAQRRPRLRAILVALVMVASTLTAVAATPAAAQGRQTIHVAPNGNDANPGTSNVPRRRSRRPRWRCATGASSPCAVAPTTSPTAVAGCSREAPRATGSSSPPDPANGPDWCRPTATSVSPATSRTSPSGASTAPAPRAWAPSAAVT